MEITFFPLEIEVTLCLICHDNVALSKEYNEESKHANAYNKLSESDCAEKARTLQDRLATQKQFFMWAHKSN